MLARTLCFLAIVTTTTGCADLLSFDLDAELEEIVVEGDPNLHHQKATVAFDQIPPVELQLGAIQQGSVYLSSMTWHITDRELALPDDSDTFEFMTSMTISVMAANPHSKLPPIDIAHWEGPAPMGDMVIDLDVNDDVDLVPYTRDGIMLHVQPKGIVPYDDVSMKATAVFAVEPL